MLPEQKNSEPAPVATQSVFAIVALMLAVAYVSWQASAKYVAIQQVYSEHAAFKVQIDNLVKENEKLKSQFRPTPIGNPAGSPTPLGSSPR